MKFNVKHFLHLQHSVPHYSLARKQDKAPVNTASEIPAGVINQIKAQGFSDRWHYVSNGGYVVRRRYFSF
jgi:hypothetical protein